MSQVVILARDMKPRENETSTTCRYIGTVSRPEAEVWRTFLDSLATALSNSGLGTIPVGQVLDEPAEPTGPPTDLFVVLHHHGYGRVMVEDYVRQHDIDFETPVAPRCWFGYRCDEYFANGWWNPEHAESQDNDGCIRPCSWIYEVPREEFLAIGTSGCDGIDFGYRKSERGLWAYYPGEAYCKPMAETLAELSRNFRAAGAAACCRCRKGGTVRPRGR